MTATRSVRLELTLNEVTAVGDFIGYCVTAGVVDEWAAAHPDDALGFHLGLALVKLSAQLQQAGDALSAAR